MSIDTDRDEAEARLAQLIALRGRKAEASKRRRWAVMGALGAIGVAVAAGLWVIDMGASGVSSRSPLYLLVGFAAVAALPALYFALRPPSKVEGEGAAAALGVRELDAVIHHVTEDLERQSMMAPEHSLALVEMVEGGEAGALSTATEDSEGAVALAESEEVLR